MEKVIRKIAAQTIIITLGLVALLIITGAISLKAQLTTAYFVPESSCTIADANTFVMADVAGEVGTARYASAVNLANHIEVEIDVKMLGAGSAGFVVGTVPSVPASAYSTTTGGWPTPGGKIMVKLERGSMMASLKLIVNGATVWSTPIPMVAMGTCQKVKINLVPGDAGASRIKVSLNNVLRVDYPVNYKMVVFGGASSTNFRIWGVSLASSPVFVSLNGVCASETSVVTYTPPAVSAPMMAATTKTPAIKKKPAAIIVMGVGAAIVAVSGALFGKDLRDDNKLEIMK